MENKHIERIRRSHLAKSRVNSVVRASKMLLTIHEEKLKQGDSWRNAYRLPEAFGICERKVSDLLDFLPEVVIKGDMMDDKNFAVASKATLEHFKNACKYKDVQARVITSSVYYGTGVLWNGVAKLEKEIQKVNLEEPSLLLSKGEKEKVCTYYGLAPEYVDIRDFFPDPTATVDHDPTGNAGMDWAYRRRIYSLASFKEKYAWTGKADKVEGWSWNTVEVYLADRPSTKTETEEKSGTGDSYVVVFEGIDVVEDEQVFLANDVLIYEGANPYAHKEIPVSLYYNYKRDDSIWGISELEINAPYIFIKELLMNLVIDNAKFSQQPVIAVNGDLNFDADQFRLEAGGIWQLTGLNGGSIKDAIQPLTFGSAVDPAMAVKQMLEDHQIQQTGDDSRSLMAQPNELATQTMAKRQALQKRIRKNVMINSIHAEETVTRQMFSNIHQFLSAPFVNMQGKTVYHEIYVDNYRAVQRSAKGAVRLLPEQGAVGVFKLNSKLLNPEKIRFQVVEKTDDTIKKEVEMQGLQWWMQTIFSFAQAQPDLIQNLDLGQLAKQTGSYFSGLDTEAIFNSHQRGAGVDEMSYYLQQIALGIQPTFPQDGNNFRRLEEFNNYLTTPEYDRTIKSDSRRSQLYATTLLDLTKSVLDERRGSFADFLQLRRSSQSMQRAGVNEPVRPTSATNSPVSSEGTQPNVATTEA